ncbi:serine/threonine-protein kinase prp4-like isoform X17 [Nymphaea colorata]|uniref:serine/threonine-protein kinase prp4-like isoform X17 n=1 Tax=Nymphaea colorata TaxID=210225 RepID=UPI00214E7DC0|nr:serine/threonine-protein kinase prp4-like isoform X17 [Nymphaea colorata]
MILYQNVNEAKNVLKLCNFGNAMFAGKNDTIVVSLFIGCCLYELYTGKVFFPGPSNNDMLRLHMELKGPFHKKMLRKGAFTDHHFDQDLNFHATEEDPVTKKVNLLFAINVAEEGLDIQTCCLIICFDLPSTVASYIQSKGRAHM